MDTQLIKKLLCVTIVCSAIILQTHAIVFGDCPPSYCIGFNFEACNNACFDQCGFNVQCHYGCSRICGHINSDCSDEDRDGMVNICDNCHDVYNPDQADANGDGIGDACQNTTTTTVSTTTTTINPTFIELNLFTATPKPGKVILQWKTESEIDNAGFNLYRATAENGKYLKINNTLITAEGSPTQGASYAFTDNNVHNRETYYYKLEDIDLNGTSTMHGPMSATPRWIFGFRN